MRRVVAVVLCVVALGAACGRSSSPVAATINDSKITTRDLVDELNAILANKDYIDSLQSASTGRGITVLGSTPGSFDAAFVSQVLLRQLDYALIHAEVAKRKIPIDDACKLEARNNATLNLAQGNPATGGKTGEELFTQFPTHYQDVLVQRYSDLIALEGALSGQQCGKGVDAEAFYNADQDQFTEVCLSLIVVPDQPQADSVMAQARGGADFAALAQQFSTDEATKENGGVFGCRAVSSFAPAIAQQLQAANVGDVLSITGQGGVGVIKVTDSRVAPLEEVRGQAEELASTTAGQSFRGWLQEAHATASVTVEPRYGTFNPELFRIESPTVDLSSNAPSNASSSPADNP